MKKITLIFLFFYCFSFSQIELKEAHLVDFKTTEGKVINKLRINYRTLGKINQDSSNVILWPSWFTGTSKDILDSGLNTMNTDEYYIIMIDALTNGVSSSPSNSPNFPKVSIQDMVKSQYELLTKHLKLKNVHAVMGISMGGMQALEWALAYPEFSEKIVSISGTPRMSFYDMYVWKSMEDLILNSGDSQKELETTMKRVYDIFWLNATTPKLLNQYDPENLAAFRKSKYENMLAPEDYLAGIQAMMNHDIFDGKSTAHQKPEADILIVVSPTDRIVSPQYSIALSEKWDTELLVLEGECGHGAAWCESEKIKEKVSEFLRSEDQNID